MDTHKKFGANMEDDFIIFESPPSIIATLLHFDKLGLTKDRGCNIVVDTT